MGTYLNYYIEYKTKDNKWNLLSFEVPISKLNNNDCPTNSRNDIKYKTHYEFWRQGIIRDIFSERCIYYNNKSFTGRGFPNDLSIELKNILDLEYNKLVQEQKKEFESHDTIYDEEKLKKGYFERVPRNRNFDIEKDFHDYRWDKTYCTLSELSAFQEELYDESVKNLEKYKCDSEFKTINDKLNYLIDKSQNKKTKYSKSINEEYDSEIESEYQESVDNAKYLGDWIFSISEIVNMYTDDWIDYNDIRIISYLC